MKPRMIEEFRRHSEFPLVSKNPDVNKKRLIHILSALPLPEDKRSDQRSHRLAGDRWSLHRTRARVHAPMDTGIDLPKGSCFPPTHPRSPHSTHNRRREEFEGPRKVTVTVGPKAFCFERELLQRHSLFFRQHFLKDEVAVDITPLLIPLGAFKALIGWMNTRQLALSMDNVAALIDTAQKLQMTEAVRICTDFLVMSLKTKSGKGECGENLQPPRARRAFREVVKTPEFLDYTVEQLEELLSDDRIDIRREKEVFDAAVRWLTHDWKRRRPHARQIMACIRFGLMPDRDLLDITRKDVNLVVMEVPSCQAYALCGLLYHSALRAGTSKEQIRFAPKPRSWLKEQAKKRTTSKGGRGDAVSSYSSSNSTSDLSDDGCDLSEQTLKQNLLLVTCASQQQRHVIPESPMKEEMAKERDQDEEDIDSARNLHSRGGNNYDDVLESETTERSDETSYIREETRMTQTSPQEEVNQKQLEMELVEHLRAEQRRLEEEQHRLQTIKMEEMKLREMREEQERLEQEITRLEEVRMMEQRRLEEEREEMERLEAQRLEEQRRAETEQLRLQKREEAKKAEQRRLMEEHLKLQRLRWQRAKAAVMIQATWRGFWCRIQFLRMRSAAIIIQRTIRNFCERKRTRLKEMSRIRSRVVNTQLLPTQTNEEPLCRIEPGIRSFCLQNEPSILVLGGVNPFGTWNYPELGLTMFRFSPRWNRWDMIGYLPEPRIHAAATVLNGTVYLTGGCDPRESDRGIHLVATCSVWELHLSGSQWRRQREMTHSRMHHSLCACSGRVFAIGGLNEKKRLLDSVEAFDPETCQWTIAAPLSGPRMCIAAASHRNHIWACGGFGTAEPTSRPDMTSVVERYCPDKNKWKRMSELRMPRCFASATSYAGHFCLIGGSVCERSLTSTGDIDIYVEQHRAWTKALQMDWARHSASVVVIEDYLHIIGGATTRAPNALSSMECYCQRLGSWLDEVCPLPLPLVGMDCVPVPPLEAVLMTSFKEDHRGVVKAD